MGEVPLYCARWNATPRRSHVRAFACVRKSRYTIETIGLSEIPSCALVWCGRGFSQQLFLRPGSKKTSETDPRQCLHKACLVLRVGGVSFFMHLSWANRWRGVSDDWPSAQGGWSGGSIHGVLLGVSWCEIQRFDRVPAAIRGGEKDCPLLLDCRSGSYVSRTLEMVGVKQRCPPRQK
jgi:hypothetical protein